MKKTSAMMTAVLLSLVLVSCGAAATGSSRDSVSGTVAASGTVSVSGSSVTDNEWKSAYESYMDHLYQSSKHPGLLHYFVRDIDQNGAPELFVIDHGVELDKDELTVYTYAEDGVTETGGRGMNGTTRFLYSEDPSCPGVFTFDVGGGLERYGYMTLGDGRLSDIDLWNEDYSGISKELGKDRGRIEETSSDKRLIRESKKVYKKDQDIEYLKIKAKNVIPGEQG